MPCHFPIQVYYRLSPDGKKDMLFSHPFTNTASRYFREGLDFSHIPNIQTIPCRRCKGCRLEDSRQWAVRCVHEASLYEDNSFITLTYNKENLPVNGSLDFDHLQLFMKRLRERLRGIKIRSFGCGEYGESFSRPHFHVCIFGYGFPDKLYWKTVNKQRLYVSSFLEDVWGKGYCVIGDVSFESAAYVARYCTKKINGQMAENHYDGRVKEDSRMSNKPGIGAPWFDKWKSDVYPSDFIVINGFKCKPPRYYDKLLEESDPLMFEKVKRARLQRALEKADHEDNTHRRLMDRENMLNIRFNKLIRTLEKELVV